MALDNVFTVKLHTQIGEEVSTTEFHYRDLQDSITSTIHTTLRLARAFNNDCIGPIRAVMCSDVLIRGLTVAHHPKSGPKRAPAILSFASTYGTITTKQSIPGDGCLCIKGQSPSVPRKHFSRNFLRGVPEDMYLSNGFNSGTYATALTTLLNALSSLVVMGSGGTSEGRFYPVLVYRTSPDPDAPLNYAQIYSRTITPYPSRQRRGTSIKPGIWSAAGLGTPSDVDLPPEELTEDVMGFGSAILVPPVLPPIEEP